ncbi:hypothetical protein SAMN04487981_103183 [Streptomyces sp. cf386]|uniref:hypothetical protein n=1 Tax=Streptomyces sp. cf386 TaxID=1761904 RepID=UPI0008853BB0|nr:hypothetical protein [Streptomyces sp. cf386]SDM99185.1 hypothetical protein SAMN04487981_103183 [Streptomyces sp. cf386]
MGEQRSGGGLEALLSAAVLRGHPVDTEGEQRAVAAFRAARDAGAHRARTRRRDDWRPRGQWRPAHSVKTALSLFAASLTLGGVAYAAIGSSDTPDASDRKGRPTPTAGTLGGPATDPSAGASGTASGKPGHPATAQDTEAKCRAYDQVAGRGQALDSTAWQRLVTEAGGADKVAAYCAERLAAAKSGAEGKSDGSGSAGNGQAENGPAENGQGESGPAENGQDRSGESGSGKSAENTAKAESTENAEKKN